MIVRHFILLIAVSLFFGCASPATYEWGNYEQTLYKNYKNPNNDEELFTELKALVTKYESEAKPNQKPMAPGLYAEYGFLLMIRGENQRAIDYFNKEKSIWPQSSTFMDRMIQTAQITRESTSKTETVGDSE